MTLSEVIKALECIAEKCPNIHSVGHNDIYDLNNIPNVEFGVFYVTQNRHTLEGSVLTFDLNLFYVDRLTADRSNQLQIISEGITTLTEIVNKFGEIYTDAELDGAVTFQPFFQRFGTDCAGVYAGVTINTTNLVGVCSYDI